MLVGLGDVGAVHQRVDGGVELAALGGAQRRRERLDPGLADDDQGLDQLLALGGDRAPGATRRSSGSSTRVARSSLTRASTALLIEGTETPNVSARSLTCRGSAAWPSPPSSSSALHWVIERPGLLDHPQLVAAVIEEDVPHSALSRAAVSWASGLTSEAAASSAIAAISLACM